MADLSYDEVLCLKGDAPAEKASHRVWTTMDKIEKIAASVTKISASVTYVKTAVQFGWVFLVAIGTGVGFLIVEDFDLNSNVGALTTAVNNLDKSVTKLDETLDDLYETVTQSAISIDHLVIGQKELNTHVTILETSVAEVKKKLDEG